MTHGTGYKAASRGSMMTCVVNNEHKLNHGSDLNSLPHRPHIAQFWSNYFLNIAPSLHYSTTYMTLGDMLPATL